MNMGIDDSIYIDDIFEYFFEVTSLDNNMDKSLVNCHETYSTLKVSKKRNRVINRSMESILRRNIKRRKYILPRVVKRDLRRQLGYMIANLINSGNKELIYKFNTTFCLPNCQLEKYSLKEIESLQLSNYPIIPSVITSLDLRPNELWVSKVGIKEISSFQYISSQMSPDLVFNIHSYNIFPNIDNKSSKIIIQVQIIGTSISSDIICPSCQQIHTINQSCKDKTVDIIGSSSSLCSFKANGQQVLEINENNCISKLSFYPISIKLNKI